VDQPSAKPVMTVMVPTLDIPFFVNMVILSSSFVAALASTVRRSDESNSPTHIVKYSLKRRSTAG
jgi:hypothetical protein